MSLSERAGEEAWRLERYRSMREERMHYGRGFLLEAQESSRLP